MIDCERCWTVLQKMRCKTSTNVLRFWECLCLRHWKHLYSWDKITQTICIPSKIQGKVSGWKRCSRYLKSLAWRRNQTALAIHDVSSSASLSSVFPKDVERLWLHALVSVFLFSFPYHCRTATPCHRDAPCQKMRFLECLKSAGKILHGNNYLWSMMKRSSVSRMQRLMYSQILCYVLERWTRTRHQILLGNNSWIGSKIHHHTEHWTQLTENRWNSSGIFPRIHYIAAHPRSPKVHEKWANQNNSKDELSSCRWSMTSFGELKTMNRNVLLIPHLCLYLHKDLQQDIGHSSDLDQKQSGILLTTKDNKENGTESLNWWWSNSEKADTQFSEPRVHCLEERSKAKEVEKLSVHFCADRDTIETVFRTMGRPVLAEQSDPLFAPANLLIMTPRPSIEILAQEILL